ncbi:MAG TPA: hypothetical protein VH227_03095 [Candidatus Udaeobacter sp.]|nr:hypothetical protein [Candidatus Udaeobacter sp.]
MEQQAVSTASVNFKKPLKRLSTISIDHTWLKPGVNETTIKNREENDFSSRVEVRVVTPKKFGAVNSAIGLVPFLFR